MSGEANTDVRLPIGGLFTLLGAIVGVYGALTAGEAARYERSLGVNINLWWGVVMFAFGLLLLLLARASRHAPPATAPGDVHGSGVAE